MAREFVLNPETGKASVQVISYQDIERSELENTVNSEQASNDALRSQLEALQAELNASDGRLSDSKSELTSHDQVAPESGTVDGTEGASSEAETETAEVETSESEYAEIV